MLTWPRRWLSVRSPAIHAHVEFLLCFLPFLRRGCAYGVLFAALVDPGGNYATRAARVGIFGLIGAALTALGFGIGGDAWGWLVLAVSW